jgi:hypothetical protein
MKLPPELEVETYAGSVTVRYDYDPGESQWFDHRAGVGGPGCDPWVEISEIKTDDGWRTPDELPEMDLEAVEEALMARIGEMQAERDHERADALYDAMREDRDSA